MRADTATRIEVMVKERENLGTYEVIREVSKKTRKRRRREEVTSSPSCKIGCPSETAASCGGGTRGEGQNQGKRRRGEEMQ